MKLHLIFALMISIFSLNTNAQTADEILDQYFENIGGKDKLNKLEGLHIKAKTLAQGMEIPIDMYTFKDGKKLVKFTLQGKEMTQMAFDGKEAWGMNFMNQKAEKLDKEATENLIRNAKDEFPNPFLNYKEKGYKVEYLGKEEIEGTECFKIKLTEHPILKNGKEIPNISYYYLDAENYVPIVVETIINEGPYKGKKMQQVFSDYQEVDGLYFPFSIANKLEGNPAGQSIKFESIILNPKMDIDMFKFPETEKK